MPELRQAASLNFYRSIEIKEEILMFLTLQIFQLNHYFMKILDIARVLISITP